MVLSFVLNLATDATIYTIKGLYSWGRYFMYGYEETTNDKLDRIVQENEEIKRSLEELKTSFIVKTNGEVH